MSVLGTCWLLLSIILLLLCDVKTKTCIKNLPSKNELQYLAARCDLNSSLCLTDSHDGHTYIFPDFRFSCNGFVTTWSAAGLAHLRKFGTDPEIIIWRKKSEKMDYSIGDTISMLHCNGDLITRKISASHYHCKLEDEVQVEQGDLLGLQIPLFMDNYDQFKLYFDREPNSFRACIKKGSITRFQLPKRCPTRGLPLLSLEVQPQNPDETNGTFEITTEGQQTTTTVEGNQMLTNLHHLPGITAAVFVFVALLAVLISFQYCYIMKKARKKPQNPTTSQSQTHEQRSQRTASYLQITPEQRSHRHAHKTSDQASKQSLPRNSAYDPMNRLSGRKFTLVKAPLLSQNRQRANTLKIRCHSMDDLSSRTAQHPKLYSVSVPKTAVRQTKNCPSTMPKTKTPMKSPKKRPMMPPKSPKTVVLVGEEENLSTSNGDTIRLDQSKEKNKCDHHKREENPQVKVTTPLQHDAEVHEYDVVGLHK